MALPKPSIESLLQSVDEAIAALSHNQPEKLNAPGIVQAVDCVNAFNQKHLRKFDRIKIKRKGGIAVNFEILQLLRGRLETVRDMAPKIALNRKLHRQLTSTVRIEMKKTKI